MPKNNTIKANEAVEPKATKEPASFTPAADEADKAIEEPNTDPKADAESELPKAEVKTVKSGSKANAKAEAESTEGLVKMHKDGEHLHVHPTTVEAHKSVGWNLA